MLPGDTPHSQGPGLLAVISGTPQRQGGLELPQAAKEISEADTSAGRSSTQPTGQEIAIGTYAKDNNVSIEEAKKSSATTMIKSWSMAPTRWTGATEGPWSSNSSEP